LKKNEIKGKRKENWYISETNILVYVVTKMSETKSLAKQYPKVYTDDKQSRYNTSEKV